MIQHDLNELLIKSHMSLRETERNHTQRREGKVKTEAEINAAVMSKGTLAVGR